MKQAPILILLSCILIFGSCGDATTSTQSQAEAKPAAETTTTPAKGEWVSLFDGKTMDGWHLYNKKGDSNKGSWSVEDGALTMTPKSGDRGDIVTDKAYQNYEMELEWKISDCGNSGIIYNVQEGDYEATYRTGPEMQVLDNKCHPDAKIITHRAGDLYDMIKCNEETVKPANEWNIAKIVITDTKGEHWLNGKKVVEFAMHDDSWTAMIGESKFKDWPAFGKFKGGHIALQDHSDKVWYRNIRIREL